MPQGQSSRQIVHRATRNAATAVAVVAANALTTRRQAMPVNAMSLGPKDAMSVVQSAIGARTRVHASKHQRRARQRLRQ